MSAVLDIVAWVMVCLIAAVGLGAVLLLAVAAIDEHFRGH